LVFVPTPTAFNVSLFLFSIGWPILVALLCSSLSFSHFPRSVDRGDHWCGEIVGEKIFKFYNVYFLFTHASLFSLMQLSGMLKGRH
jgi:hypothetical protein